MPKYIPVISESKQLVNQADIPDYSMYSYSKPGSTIE